MMKLALVRLPVVPIHRKGRFRTSPWLLISRPAKGRKWVIVHAVNSRRSRISYQFALGVAAKCRASFITSVTPPAESLVLLPSGKHATFAWPLLNARIRSIVTRSKLPDGARRRFSRSCGDRSHVRTWAVNRWWRVIDPYRSPSWGGIQGLGWLDASGD